MAMFVLTAVPEVAKEFVLTGLHSGGVVRFFVIETEDVQEAVDEQVGYLPGDRPAGSSSLSIDDRDTYDHFTQSWYSVGRVDEGGFRFVGGEREDVGRLVAAAVEAVQIPDGFGTCKNNFQADVRGHALGGQDNARDATQLGRRDPAAAAGKKSYGNHESPRGRA
jgi:hypothetical protein